MFWSGETIHKNLKDLIFDSKGNSIGDPDQIDCAAYQLTIGPQVFITPTQESDDKKGHTRINLKKEDDFVIPKGQFAFLLSEEIVSIPNNILGLISFKTKKLKFRGLVNVSGFHVDPGFKGRIIFSLFNAGPLDITLKRGMPFALLWFAKLDKKTSKVYKSGAQQNLEIDPEITGCMNSVVHSPGALHRRIDELEKRINDSALTQQKWFFGILIVILVGTLVNLFSGFIADHIKAQSEISSTSHELGGDA